jgi:hypothetical protein
VISPFGEGYVLVVSIFFEFRV